MSAAHHTPQAGPLPGLNALRHTQPFTVCRFKLMTPSELRALADGMPLGSSAEVLHLAAELHTMEELRALLGRMAARPADLETVGLDPYKAAGAGLGEKGGQA